MIGTNDARVMSWRKLDGFALRLPYEKRSFVSPLSDVAATADRTRKEDNFREADEDPVGSSELGLKSRVDS